MRRIGFLFLFGLLSGLTAAEDLPPEKFMERVRYPNSGRSMAALSGILQYKAEGKTMETVPVYLGLLIEPGKVRGQLLLDDREEYRMEMIQPASPKEKMQLSVTSGVPGASGSRRLPHYGLKPEDLMTGFIYYPLHKELAETRVKGLPCRVMVLTAPDGKEAVRAFFLKAHYFPIRAEFYAGAADAADGKNRMKSLEIGSFMQQNKLYYAQVIDILGPDWRSRVTFDRAELSVPPIGAKPPFKKVK